MSHWLVLAVVPKQLSGERSAFNALQLGLLKVDIAKPLNATMADWCGSVHIKKAIVPIDGKMCHARRCFEMALTERHNLCPAHLAAAYIR